MNIEKTLKSNSKGLKNNHMQKKVNNAVRKINAFPELVKNFSSHVSKLKQAHSKHLHMIKSLSKFNSAFTFQQSIPEISFSKADRFLNPSPKDQISSLLLLPSTLISKNYNLGYGTKYYFPKHIIINALENPSPSAYITHADLTKSTLQNITKGRSFGISHKYYQKNFLPHCKTQNLEQNKHFPGPGKYNLDREIGDLSIANKRRVNLRIKGKIGNFIDDEIKNDQSPKKYYYPNTDSTKNLRYSSVGFGMGEKFDFTNTPVAENPGPGQYEVKGMGKKKGRKVKKILQ